MISKEFMEHSMMREKAYAKITLSLYAYWDEDVLKFKNVIVPIDLFDMVYLDKHETMEITSNKKFLPNDKRNTVYLALDILKKKYKIKDNFKVHIVKNIPAQSGLGGGSSNAATIINMFDKMYQLNMSLEDKMSVAEMIDEDTPYCIQSKPATVEGIGEIVTPFEMKETYHYLLVKPGFGVSTKSFLKKFKDTDPAFEFNMEHMKVACIEGNFEDILKYRYNSFEKTVGKRSNRMASVIKRFEKMGLEGVGMTGSGSCVYGLSKDKDKVMELFEKISIKYPFVKYGSIRI